MIELTAEQIDVIRQSAQKQGAQDSPVPLELRQELLGPITDLVFVPHHQQRTLTDVYGQDQNWFTNLNADWEAAKQLGAVYMFSPDTITFPLHDLTDDGQPIVASIRRSSRPEGLPWYMAYVTHKHSKTYSNPANALWDWAFFPGGWETILPPLADLALDESWDFIEERGNSRKPYSILRSYLTYTFYKLQSDGMVFEDEDAQFAAFNTGLVNKTYEAIYACFTANERGPQPWIFQEFCYAGQSGAGKKLVSTFNPLPPRAKYVKRLEDLVFDGTRRLDADREHILLDNIDRLPDAFLSEELRGFNEASSFLENIYSTADRRARKDKFSDLAELIQNEPKYMRRLTNRLNDAIELAQKRAQWNYRTAVPAYYPTKGTMTLLLPLDLTDDERPDVALVSELMPTGVYVGHTILTMRMAYNNARLVSRPDSDWLNTGVKLFGGEYDE